MRQKDTTLQMLRAAGERGVHTFEMRRAFIGNPSQRIAELIEDGHGITTGPKERLNGEAMGVRYFLVHDAAATPAPAAAADPDEQGALFAMPSPAVRSHWEEAA
jgi:hypothetical protein